MTNHMFPGAKFVVTQYDSVTEDLTPFPVQSLIDALIVFSNNVGAEVFEESVKEFLVGELVTVSSRDGKSEFRYTLQKVDSFLDSIADDDDDSED